MSAKRCDWGISALLSHGTRPLHVAELKGATVWKTIVYGRDLPPDIVTYITNPEPKL